MYSHVKADKTAYAFTVKDNRRETTDYSSFFDRLSKFDVEIDCKYKELDSKGKVHYHGIVLIPKGMYRKKLMMPGLHLKLEELYNREGWMKYITKDQMTPPNTPFRITHSDPAERSDPTLDDTTDETIEDPLILLKRYV